MFKVQPHGESWERVSNNFSFETQSDGFSCSFSHTFDYSQKCKTYFAFTYPWNITDSNKKFESIEEKFSKNDNCYFHHEVLGESLEKRPVDLYTISGMEGITEEREPLLKNLFPKHKKDPTKRPFIFKKQSIVLTARVHPGELPCSHVLNGILNMISDLDSEYGKILRKNFVFKIIPFLNPDGVYRGYYRLDTRG